MVISGLLRLFNIILFDKKDRLPPLKMIAPEKKFNKNKNVQLMNQI